MARIVPSVPMEKNDLIPIVIGIGILGGVLIWLTKSSTASARTSPTGHGAISVQDRPFPPDFNAVSDTTRKQYFSKGQAQLNTLGLLPLASITWGDLDDLTYQALVTFVRSDPALLARVHAAPTRQTSMALDALDRAYRSRLGIA